MSLAQHHAAVALLTIGDALGSLPDLRHLAEICPAPLHRWMPDQRYKILALALDAIERGDIPHDDGAIMDYLSRIRFSDALDAFKGKPLALVAGLEHGETALIGGATISLICEARAIRSTGDGLTYGSPARVAGMLRNLADRTTMLAELSRTAAALAKVSITEDAAPILAPLAALLRTGASSVGERSIGDALGGAIAAAERESLRSGAQGITWGLESLDKAVPLRRGRLYVLSARPGGGKTSLGIQAAHQTSLALGHRSVAYLSLEMGAHELAMALACRECQIPRRQAEERWGTLLAADQQELRALSAKWSSEGSLWIRDASAGPQTVASVGSWIRGQKARHGALQLVVVDYLGLIKGSNPRQMLIDKTAEITSTLKQIALAEGVSIILLAQLTREGRKPTRGADGKAEADPVPRMEDLYGGSAIESDADAIVFLHPLQREGAQRRIDAIVAKNRNGPDQLALPLWFFGLYQHFQDAVTDPAPAAKERSSRQASTPTPAEGDPWN